LTDQLSVVVGGELIFARAAAGNSIHRTRVVKGKERRGPTSLVHLLNRPIGRSTAPYHPRIAATIGRHEDLDDSEIMIDFIILQRLV
jgi:hypothetical protein